MSLKTRAEEIITGSTFEPMEELFVDVAEIIEAGVLIPTGDLDVINLTESGGDVTFPKFIGPNASNYSYSLYSSSSESGLTNVDTIESQSLESTDLDVSTLSFTATGGELIYLGLLLEDPISGYKYVYTPVDVLMPEQEISDIEIYDQDPDGAFNPQPIASFQNSGSIDLSSAQGEILLHFRVEGAEGADEAVTVTSSNTNKLTINQVDGTRAYINYVTSEPGDVVTVNVTSDFDSFFEANLDVSLHEDTPVTGTESTTFELQT